MSNKLRIIEAMRAAVRAGLPPQAFLKRDRNDALFITNAPAFTPETICIPGFCCQRQGMLLRIWPDETHLLHMEESAPQAPDHFSKTLMRFRGKKPVRENLLLWIQGAKLLDAAGISEAEYLSFDRDLRRRAAVALRNGEGGGLYACALLLIQINTLYKGEQPS